VLWGLLAMTAGGGLYWFVAVPATPVPHGSASRARFTPGPWEVADERFTAVDTTRPTPADEEYAGADERVLEGEIWRPAGLERPGPLVVYSHGFMSFRREGLYLARFLASHGYTVVAADYPLTGFGAPGGPQLADVVNQPGDVSFLITTLLARSTDPQDSLHNTIDPGQIAVAGVSLGGLTSLLAGFHRELRDPRIAAVVSIAGPTSILGPGFFAGGNPPLLMVYGSGDAIVTYRDNALPVLAEYPDTILVTLANASHAGFAQAASTLMRFIDNPDVIGCKAVVENLHLEATRQNLAFLEKLDQGDDGVDTRKQIEFCTGKMIPVAMPAARQHMFTTLAVHAFLDSLFASDAGVRAAARHYLLADLAAENGEEVSVTEPENAPAHQEKAR
jgi:predicted dienelactone hydrolase